MSKLIILTTNDTVKVVDYRGYDTISEAVNGYIEHFWDIPNKTKDTFLSFYCNEEFMLKNDKPFDKFNAIAYLICNEIIYGDVAVIVDPDYEKFDDDSVTERGLTNDEVDFFNNYIQELISHSDISVDELHKEYDNDTNKPRFRKGIPASAISYEDLVKAMNKLMRSPILERRRAVVNKGNGNEGILFMSDDSIHINDSNTLHSELIFGEQKKHSESDVSFVSINEQEKSIVSGNIPLKQKQKDVSFVSLDEQQKDILNKK